MSTSDWDGILTNSLGISLPEGFRVVRLDDIADLKLGLAPESKVFTFRFPKPDGGEEKRDVESISIHLLTPKSILSDGNLDLEKTDILRMDLLSDTSGDLKINLRENLREKDYLAEPNDIFISRILTKTSASIAMAPDTFPDLVTFANSIIRVRVKPNCVDPKYVLQFFKSDIGWTILNGFASSLAGLPRISISGLAQTPVLLPDDGTERGAEDLNEVANAIRKIEDEILPRLEGIESARNQAFPVDLTSKNSKLKVIGEQLSQLASKLAPPSLSERVMSDYPTPIALAYRRFYDSEFNAYEQVLRLRDLYESATYFVYSLMLADVAQQSKAQHFYIQDKGIRQAYSGDSMASRISFIREISKVAKSNVETNLFISELAKSSFVDWADKLREFRNHLSHTPTAPEGKQRKVIIEHKPIIENLLSELEFLSSYRLVRVLLFQRKRGQFICRMEIYRGVAPFLEEKEIASDLLSEGLTRAEHDHLVILNNADQVLDLFPLYQILSSEETQDESHICFLKRYRSKDKRLEGESVQNSRILSLEGFDEFEELKQRLEKVS